MITIHLPLHPSCLIFLVRLGGYTVNLRLLFLQAHRETERFFAVSGVKSKIGNILTEAVALRITLNIDGAPIVSRSHTHPSLTNISSINLVSIFSCSSSPRNPVYVRRVDPSTLAFSISSHRHL
jgi:hypothetical protein